jgi:amidophosphoribosyltransferase
MLREADDESPREKCGVFGVFSPSDPAANIAFFGLFALQHRGQESAGIAVSDGAEVRMHKGMGLVSQVFRPEDLAELPGHLAVGHNRYSTTGASVLRNAQPVYCQSLVGEIAVAHNGNLTNTATLRAELRAEGEVLNSNSDTELMARILVRRMHEGPEAAVAEVMRRCEGAYSVAVLTPRQILAFRDPYGLRPLSAGTRKDGYMVASETCAFGPVGGVPTRELAPGELCVIDKDGMRFSSCAAPRQRAMCLFEFIYFARPDSEMYGELLYSVRERMGERLALESPVEADIVVPVPDSGVPAALGFSRQSGIAYREGMMKSRYIHRTFIQPDQSVREQGVRQKLTPLVPHLEGKRVVLVDDSIVRGTTTRQIVKMMFDSRAAEVHVRITAPPVKYPCFYGIDMATKQQLIAARRTVPEIRDHLGATSLAYLSLEGALWAAGGAEQGFCTACFSGRYPIPIPAGLEEQAQADVRLGEMQTYSPDQPALIE